MAEDKDCYYNGTPSSCLDLKNDTVLEILSALSPNCERGAWTPITFAWKVFFYLEISLSALLYFALGTVCVVLLFKRHSAQRFKAKTFVAIDVSLAILGFSRFLFYILDPYGISGFCKDIGCVVASRLLFSLGFPSLTAAYTLVFVTLWYSAKMRLGRHCIQHWKIIVPLCFIHYFVAVIVEIIGAVSSYAVVFLVLACDAVFTLWGLLVCLTFLIAGCRLLQTIKLSVRQSSVVCRENVKESNQGGTGTLSKDLRTYSVTRMKLRSKKRHKQAIRKITIITYITATLGGLYSILNLVQLITVCQRLFGPCPDKGSSAYNADSDIWLLMRYITTVLEFLMAILLVYSINDFRPIVGWLKNCYCISHSVEDEKNSKDKYFEETSESVTSFHFKKRSLIKRDTKNSINFTPSTLDTSMKILPLAQEDDQQQVVADHPPSNGKVIPNGIDDVESGNSVCKTEVQL